MIQRSLFFGLLTFIGLSFFLHGCETEVDLLAPYDSTPVIIGILDYTADTQFVRINRTYLGAGDANAYAQIKDSVEYDPSEVEAKLYKKRDNVVEDSIELKYIELPSRDPGVFYNEDVGFYYTDEPLLTEDEISDNIQAAAIGNEPPMTYAIKVSVRGETYTAETDFPAISSSSISPPSNPNTPFKLSLYLSTFNNYKNATFRFNTDNTGARYLGSFRINYDYTTSNGTEVMDQYLDYTIGKINNTELNSDQVQMILTSVNWYKRLGEEFQSIPDLKKVRIENVEFRLLTANEDLNTYYSIANPVSEYTPVLSTYTNLDNGAIGILGSRTYTSIIYYLSEQSLEIMNTGEYTTGPCYCVQDWPGSNYVCTEGPANCP